jgi:hypothetical protein
MAGQGWEGRRVWKTPARNPRCLARDLYKRVVGGRQPEPKIGVEAERGDNWDTSELGTRKNRKMGGQNGARASNQPKTLSIYVLRREFHTFHQGGAETGVGNEVRVSQSVVLCGRDTRKVARGENMPGGSVTGIGALPHRRSSPRGFS